MTQVAASPQLPSGPRRRSRVRLREVVGWFAGVVCAYWMYWLIAVPLIEPGIEPDMVSRTDNNNSIAAQDVKSARKQALEQYFAPGSWELENPAIWETDQTLLLFKDPKPLPDGTVELRHCTLLFFPSTRGPAGSAEMRPIVMRASEGATLEFDEPIVLKTVDLGKRRLVGGRLRGLITIDRKPTDPDTGDGLSITTRDIELVGNRAFSPHPVKFRYGRSYGSGRDLEILLDDEDGGGLRNGRVKMLILKRDVVAYLALGDPALARGRRAAQQPNLQGSMLKITCKGDFRYDFRREAASFHDRVDVVRSSVGPSDLLNCEVLTVFFERDDGAPPAQTPNPTNVAGQPGAPDDMPIRRIEARGDPVILHSPARGVYVRCHRALEFHPLPGNPFGRLVATGPGVMRGVAPGDSPTEYHIQWTRELRFEPTEGEQYVASLRGGATVRVGGLGEIAANDRVGKDRRMIEEGRIHAWVTPIAEGPPAGRVARVQSVSTQTVSAGPRQQIGRQAPTSTGGTKWQIERVLAEGDVTVDVPELDAATRKLEVWIERPKPIAGPPTGPQAPPVKDGPAPAGRTKPASRGAPSQRFLVRSGSVQVKLVPQGEQFAVASLTLENQAHLQQLSPRADAKPMVVAGDRLHVVGANTEQTRVTVAGNLARIEAGGMVLLGEAIELEQHTNRLWVAGPGKMIMPIDQDLNGRPMAESQTAEVTWQGSMNFQSNTVTFQHKVRVMSQHQLLTTERLDGVLDRAIDFSNPGPAGPPGGGNEPQNNPQLVFVRCYGEAILDSNEFNEHGQKTSADRMLVFNLTINRATGDVNGTGPGWFKHVGLGTGGPGGRIALPGANPRPNKPAAPRPGLTYLHVQFQRAVTGNLNTRQLTFGEPTKTVYAPVDDWDAKLNADDPASLGPEGMVLDARKLTVREMPARARGEDGWFELVAIGNVVAEGAQFVALGHRVTYTQDKDQMVLEGDGRSPAQISYSANQARADKIIYAVGLRHVIFSGAHSLNVGVPQRQGKDDDK